MDRNTSVLHQAEPEQHRWNCANWFALLQ